MKEKGRGGIPPNARVLLLSNEYKRNKEWEKGKEENSRYDVVTDECVTLLRESFFTSRATCYEHDQGMNCQNKTKQHL